MLYEIGQLIETRRIGGPSGIGEWRERLLMMGLRDIPLSAEIAIRASGLRNLAGDPIDRIIVATALVEDAVLLTADGSLLNWPGQLRRQDARR